MSPRRKEILKWGGWEFIVVPADINESILGNENPEGYVLRLAEKKALQVSSQQSNDKIIIAADTIVVDDNMILGKPKGNAEAEKILKQLRGKYHLVKTAIAIVTDGGKKMVSEIVTTNVPMRSYTDIEINDYITTGDPFDKAGGYAIQNNDFKPVNELNGCFANVVGLPLCHLTRQLKSMGILTEENVALQCQQAFSYDCDIAHLIL